jgi:hypothetical protein
LEKSNDFDAAHFFAAQSFFVKEFCKLLPATLGMAGVTRMGESLLHCAIVYFGQFFANFFPR